MGRKNLLTLWVVLAWAGPACAPDPVEEGAGTDRPEVSGDAPEATSRALKTAGSTAAVHWTFGPRYSASLRPGRSSSPRWSAGRCRAATLPPSPFACPTDCSYERLDVAFSTGAPPRSPASSRPSRSMGDSAA